MTTAAIFLPIVWIVCIGVIVKITYSYLRDNASEDDLFYKDDDYLLDDFYTHKCER